MQDRTTDIIKYLCFNILIMGLSMAFGWYLNNLHYLSSDLQPKAYPQSRIGLDGVFYYKNLTCLDFGNVTVVELADTHSMEPTMGHTSLAIKRQVDTKDIKIGDIISFNWVIDGKEQKVIHRVVDIRDNKFITKGDNIKFSDGIEVSPSDVTGVVVTIIY